jgi:hypothetical protein
MKLKSRKIWCEKRSAKQLYSNISTKSLPLPSVQSNSVIFFRITRLYHTAALWLTSLNLSDVMRIVGGPSDGPKWRHRSCRRNVRKRHACVFWVEISHSWFSWPGKPLVWYLTQKTHSCVFRIVYSRQLMLCCIVVNYFCAADFPSHASDSLIGTAVNMEWDQIQWGKNNF